MASLINTWEKLTLNPRLFVYLHRLNQESKLNYKEVNDIQFHRLKNILISAYLNHPFYKERFDNSGFNPFELKDTEEISSIPILEKEDYRRYCNNVVSFDEKKYKEWYKDGTSGTTGMPLKVYRTWSERAYMSAKWMRVLFSNGYSWRDKTFSLPSPHRLQKDSIIQKIGILERVSIPYTAPTREMVQGYLKEKPNIVYANKSQLVMMAIFVRDNKIDLPKPKLCISAAETMDESSRRIICEVFGEENLIEAYGAVEVNNLAWQNKGQSLFNFSHSTNLLEVVDNQGKPSASGKAIITDFFINSFPLIRYNLGDFVETENANGLQFIKKIKGRMDDWVLFSDGARIPFHAFYEIMERRSEISQFRVIQESFSLIKIQLVLGASADKTAIEKTIMNDIKKEIKEYGVEYQFEWRDKIEPDPSGKLRMLISKVK